MHPARGTRRCGSARRARTGPVRNGGSRDDPRRPERARGRADRKLLRRRVLWRLQALRASRLALGRLRLQATQRARCKGRCAREDEGVDQDLPGARRRALGTRVVGVRGTARHHPAGWAAGILESGNQGAVGRHSKPVENLGPLSEASRLPIMAEREGFEPSIHFLGVCSLSRGVPSTTRPSLRSSARLYLSASRVVKPIPLRNPWLTNSSCEVTPNFAGTVRGSAQPQ